MYKEMYIEKLLEKGFALEEAVVMQEEVWYQRSRYSHGVRDDAARQGQRITDSIYHPVNDPKNNPKRMLDSFGKQMRPSKDFRPRDGVCEVCGAVRNPNERQFDFHHITHNSHFADEAVIEVCQKCHKMIEGIGARETAEYLYWETRRGLNKIGGE
jgi:hypothetical protein